MPEAETPPILPAADPEQRGDSGAKFAQAWMTRSDMWPSSAKIMGIRPLEADPARGFCRNAYDVPPDFANIMGIVQGGFVSAMLDDTMAVGALFKLGGRFFLPTLEMKTTYLAPVSIGEVIVEGWLQHAGRTVAFLEGRIAGPDGRDLVRSTATALIKPLKRPGDKTDRR